MAKFQVSGKIKDFSNGHSLKYKNLIRRMANLKKMAIHFKIGHSLILAIRWSGVVQIIILCGIYYQNIILIAGHRFK